MRTPQLTQTAATLTVAKGKTLVYGYGLTTNNAAVNAIFYDGVGASDPEKFRIYGAAQTTASVIFKKPILFERGVHIVPSTTTAFAFVIWDSYREEATR